MKKYMIDKISKATNIRVYDELRIKTISHRRPSISAVVSFSTRTRKFHSNFIMNHIRNMKFFENLSNER